MKVVDSALFEHQVESSIESTTAMVETALVDLGFVAHECRIVTQDKTLWQVHSGSALVQIEFVFRAESWHLRVSSVVMTLDSGVNRRNLFERLLSLNGSEILGAAFALDGDLVLLVTERPTLDIDQSEASDLIKRVMQYADEYDDPLVAEFGGTLGKT